MAALHPGGVDILRGRRRLGRGHGPEHRHFAAAPVEPGAPAWRGAVDGLAALDPGRGRLDVVVSNHFVRYLTLPWEALAAAGGDSAALARASFELAWGEAGTGWAITTDRMRYGRPCLAAAMDAELVAAVRAAAAAKGLRLAALRPHLTAALARVDLGGGTETPRRWANPAALLALAKARQEAPSPWFAAWEPGRLTVLGEGAVHNLKLASPADLGPSLAQCLAAEQMGAGSAAAVVLHAPGWEGVLPAGDIRRLDTPGGADWGQAMAWCGWR